jgi:flagellar motor switch protein FliN/FliY
MTQPLEMQSFDTRAGVLADAMPLVAVESVQMTVSVQLGFAAMTVGELLRMGRGSVVMLERKVGEPVEILANGRPIARGELVVSDGQLGVTVIEIVKQPGAAP